MHQLPLRAIVALCILIGLSLACGETTADTPPAPVGTQASGEGKPISPVAAADTASAAMRTASAAGGTEAPAAKATATRQPTATATSDPCLRWDAISTDMKGEVVCMRGLISKFSQSRQVGTRYSFSDTPGTFFLFSAKYEITNPYTGKTIAPDTCVEVTGPIDVESGVPFINLDKIIERVGDDVQGFLFYDDPSACG